MIRLLPKIFEIAIVKDRNLAAMIVVLNSGNDVEAANSVTPIKLLPRPV